MLYPRMLERRHVFLFLALVAPTLLPAQTTTVNVGSTVIQSPVKRFGINIGTPNYYDSGQITKNLVFTNPSFEGEIYQSTIQCTSPTANSCTDVNPYSGFPVNFWLNASYTVISGSAAGRSGNICSFSGANYPNGGTFTFCDSGTAPATGDYIVVKTTMPANLGWPDGDWQTVVGAGTLTAETNDLPPGTLGKQSALLTAPTGNDAIAVNTFFDTTPGKSFVQLNGQYQITFLAKGLSGNKNVAVKLTRGTNTFISQTVPLTGSWAPYTLTFTGAENGTAVGNVELSFNAVGPDTIELDDLSLVKLGGDPTNTTVFRDEVVQAFQNAQPGVIRYWLDQLGESLDNLLTAPTGRQRSGYTPYAGFDGENISNAGTPQAVGTYQTQSVKVGLTDFLQLCQKVGADPWIVMPSTLSTGEAYSLMDYLAGPSTTPYGSIRAAAGETAPWTSVFKVIHLEFGNEEWNGGTFKGGAIELPAAYGGRASAIFTAIKGNPSYVQSQFDLIINGQSASPGGNKTLQSFITNNDSFSIAPYMMYNINEWDTYDRLFGTTFAEAEAFVTPGACAEIVCGGFITVEQDPSTGSGKPIVTSEMNLGPVGTPPSGGDGPMNQSIINGYASSVGGGVAVLDSMLQQLRAGVMTQNLFSLPGYITSTQTSTTAYLWGAVVDMGVTNLKRPQYLALQMANQAIGSNTQMLQTTQTGTNPTDGQYDYGLNSVSLPTMHLIQSFAFSGSGTNSVIVINASPDYAEPVNFAGTNAPTGTVNMTQLWSANPTDTNETSAVVVPTSTTIPNFSSSNTLTLPPYSMTVLTWGGSTQAAPQISGVGATPTSSTTATITWTTDEASTSQVSYGTSLPYGSQTSVSSTLTTSHSVTLTGLTPGTTYDYAVISANSSNASTTSANFTFTTTAAAPVISAVASGSITSTSAIITWTTDQASSSLVNYGTGTSYGSSATSSGTVTTHSVTLTGLTPGTTYDFDVASTNGSNLTSTSTNYSFVTLAAAGPVISAVGSGQITSTSAVIIWTTDQASTSQVKYGTTQSYGSTSGLNSNLQTSHSVTLSGLTPGTTYDFQVISTNGSSVTSTSANYSFATTAVAPVISSVSSGSITSTSAVITWATDQTSSSLVNYGTSTGYGSSSTSTGTGTSHTVTLTGLTPGTTYDFDVVSTNSSNLTATSTNYSFVTTAVAPVISAVSSSSITSTSAIIMWTTDQASSSLVNYGTSTGYGSSSTSAGTATSHTVTLTGLTPGTTYDFDVVSTNSSNLTATSTNYSFATTAPAAPVISAVTSGSISTTSATITWTTDQLSSSQVKYGTTQTYGSLSTLNSSLTMSHSVTLSGLTAGTTYDFEVISTNGSSVSATSTNYSFTTTAAAAPVISNVATSAITSSSVTISWTTDQATSSQVNYGTTMSYGSSSALNSALVTSHSVTLTGLTAGTTYDFDVVSANSSNVSATSGNSTFATSAATGPAPYVGYVAFWGINNTGITISWSTDQLANTQLAYGTTTALGQLSPLQTTLAASHGVVLTTLNPGTTYYFVAQSTNASGVTGYSTVYTFTTTGTASTPAPVISAVTATGITSTSATITWTTDQASSSQVNYGTTTSYGSSSAVNTSLVMSHSVTLTGLTPGTTYDFDVVSANSSSVSSNSSNSTFTTTSAVAGPVITNVATSALSSNSVTITWTTDQASSSLVNYGTTTGYGSSSTPNTSLVTSHSVTLTGLTAGTTYDFDVVSANSSSVSSTSSNSTFTTTSIVAGPVITNVATSAITSSSVTITWTTDQASSSLVNYGTTTGYGSSSTLNSSLVMSHSVTLTGLTPGTTYDFDVVSANSSNVSSNSANSTFATTAATGPAPYVGYVAFWGINNTGITISWSTDQAANTQLAYGTTTALGQLSPLQTTLTVSHGVVLTTLNPGTTYYFVAQSTNASGVTGYSTTYTFTTSGTATTPAPVISAVTATSITTSSATITWTTDQASTSLVNYGTTSSYGSSSTPNTSLVMNHSVTLTGLTAGTTYDFDVVSANSSSVSSNSANSTFTTNSAVAGPVISNVATSSLSSTSVTVTWTTDQASSSQVNYGTTTAYGSSSTLNSSLVTSHSVTLTGLTAGATYDFDVVSANSSSVSSTSTNNVFTTTAAAGPVISNVATSALSSTSVTITWTTDQASSSLVNYGTTTGYGSSSTPNTNLVTSHSVTLTGLTAGTTYDFDVVSANASSVSSTSANSTFTTSAATGTAPNISYVVSWGISNTGATVTWSTDQSSTTQLAYGTTTALGQLSPLQTTLETSHGVTLTGLNPGTTYYFVAQSTNNGGTTGYSTQFSFTTTGSSAPVISGVTVTPATGNTATIKWTTSTATYSYVQYGPAAGSYNRYSGQTSLTTSPQCTLPYVPSGVVHYQLVSTDAYGDQTVSADLTFTEP